MKSPIESMIKWHQGTADAKKGFDSDLADEIVSALTEADALCLKAAKPLMEAARLFIDAREVCDYEPPRPAALPPSSFW